MIITKEFKKALKTMENLAIRLNNEYVTVEFSKGYTAKKRITFEAKQSIENNKSFFYNMGCQNDILPILYNILKLNDKIVFRSRVNNNGYLDKAGLFNDELCISVYRKDKLIIKDMVIDWSICPDNSARAIK